MKIKAHFTNHSSGCSVGPEQLERFAADIGLDVAAPERYSVLLVFQTMTYADIRNVSRLEFPFLTTKLPHLFEAAAPN